MILSGNIIENKIPALLFPSGHVYDALVICTTGLRVLETTKYRRQLEKFKQEFPDIFA